MFPLGAVLFPHMPLRLRVFEERYLLMLSRLLEAEGSGFGVVLIERGHEVGGGEHRFGVGTVAEIAHIDTEDGVVGLVALGTRRFEVTRWLPDEPHPQAEVTWLDDLVWDPDQEPLRAEVEALVRRTLAIASEFSEPVWSSDVELSADPVEACWQLAAITPVNDLDLVALLKVTSVGELLTRVRDLTADAALAYSAPWPDQD
ncbi:MAG: peptidase [Friedmanniella sp.]|jgi:Lon protease-like protein|nr:peptidase [Friedmanniella sp.]